MLESESWKKEIITKNIKGEKMVGFVKKLLTITITSLLL